MAGSAQHERSVDVTGIFIILWGLLKWSEHSPFQLHLGLDRNEARSRLDILKLTVASNFTT